MSMHNAAPFLRECIDSILAQTFINFELLIVDDGSTDDSSEIVESYTDSRIRLIRRGHDFITSLNTLLDEARGDYIARMDADDIMLPDRLSVEVSYLDNHPDVDAVCSNATRIDTFGNKIGHIGFHSHEATAITPKKICEGNQVCNPTTMIRRSSIRRFNLRYSHHHEWAEDYAFWSSLVVAGGIIHSLPTTLLLYRENPSQVTALHYAEMMETTSRIKQGLTNHLVTLANPGYSDPPIIESDKDLTLIIPFLNEGEEVANTIRSFLEHGGRGHVEILAINDCSYDSYPYMEELSKIEGVTYILNRERLGVAASRDIGVNLCRTPYFLLLDAHMRAYDDLWVTEIPHLLAENDRRILCCQNKALKLEADMVIHDTSTYPTYGARLSLDRYDLYPGIKWIYEEQRPYDNTEAIPAVLGAGYATSKNYWNHLGGLQGLIQYGCDEQMLSLKAWLEGGECRLVKNVVLGHIYRNNMPYEISPYCMTYNSLLITELLMPVREQSLALAAAFYKDALKCRQAFAEVKKYIESVPDVRVKAKSIKQRNFDDIISINRILSSLNRKVYSDIISRLPKIADAMLVKPCHDNGLFNGTIGRSIWMFHYSHILGNDEIREVAFVLLRKTLASLPVCNADFESGLSGIGWALVYLYSMGFIPYPADSLADICTRITSMLSTDTNPSKCWGIIAFACAAAFIPDLRDFNVVNASHFEKLCQEILNSSHDVTSFFYAFLWLRLKKDGFDTAPPPLLTDWIKPPNFIASDQRFWSLSLYDGVGAASINTLLNYSIINISNEK